MEENKRRSMHGNKTKYRLTEPTGPEKTDDS